MWLYPSGSLVVCNYFYVVTGQKLPWSNFDSSEKILYVFLVCAVIGQLSFPGQIMTAAKRYCTYFFHLWHNVSNALCKLMQISQRQCTIVTWAVKFKKKIFGSFAQHGDGTPTHQVWCQTVQQVRKYTMDTRRPWTLWPGPWKTASKAFPTTLLLS